MRVRAGMGSSTKARVLVDRVRVVCASACVCLYVCGVCLFGVSTSVMCLFMSVCGCDVCLYLCVV